MGSDEAVKRLEGRVVGELPRLLFRVELDNREQVLAHLAGMVERNFVRLVPGDRVEVELAPHDRTRAKILRKITGVGGTR